MSRKKLVRITTVPSSLKILLKNQLNFMNRYFEVIAVSSSGKDLEDVAQHEGVRTYALEMTRKITPLKDMLALFRMYVLMLREKPEIVHTHTPKAGLIGMTAARLAGVRNRLHTVAGMPLMETTGYKLRLLMLIEKITYWSATQVLPNSHGLMNYIVKTKLASQDKLMMIGNGSSNGIDLEHFNRTADINARAQKLRDTYALNSEACVFLFIGRIVGDKGINELVKAFNKLSQKYPEARLLLVGKTEETLDPLRPEVNRILQSNPHICLCGFQDDVRPYLAMSDFFVFPSYREGFPNVVLQACSFNLPCIVTDINGSNEIIQDGVNGVIIKSKDSSALYRAMETLLCDQNLRQRLTLKSRSLVCEKYDQNHIWQELLTLYSGLSE